MVSMDPIEIEKFQSMKRYRRNTFLYRFTQYILSILFLGLFLSSPLWLPNVIYSIKFFLYVFLPVVRTFLLGPKCLFFICNVIIVFLLGESRRSGSRTRDVYDEYMENSKSMRKLSSMECKEKMAGLEQDKPVSSHVVVSCQKLILLDSSLVEMEGNTHKGEEVEAEAEEEAEVLEDETSGEEEEDVDGEELNKRVEDFIARFNAQRKLEARMLVCTNS